MLKDLTLTPEQAEILANFRQDVATAQNLLSAVFATIVRGHGITQANLKLLEGTTLTIEVEDGPVV